MASPAPSNGPTLEGSDRPARLARHVSPAGSAPSPHGAGAGATGAGATGAGAAASAGADASAGGGEPADASAWGYWQLRRSPARPATDPRSSPCWGGGCAINPMQSPRNLTACTPCTPTCNPGVRATPCPPACNPTTPACSPHHSSLYRLQPRSLPAAPTPACSPHHSRDAGRAASLPSTRAAAYPSDQAPTPAARPLSAPVARAPVARVPAPAPARCCRRGSRRRDSRRGTRRARCCRRRHGRPRRTLPPKVYIYGQ